MADDDVQEFVAFDASGKEVDWVDPYVSHQEIDPGVFVVSNGVHEYRVIVPSGGGRFEIRPRR